MQRASGVRFEVMMLVGFAFVLPLVEVPKTIFWLLYLVTWMVNRIKSGNFGGKWRLWDSLIGAYIVSVWIGGMFSGLDHGQWDGARDVGRYGLLLWAISRSNYTMRDWKLIFVALLAGTLIAAAQGGWLIWNGRRKEMELHSVGHSNHSAIYLCIVIGAAIAWLIAFWSGMKRGERALWLIAIVLCALALVASGSRVAIVVAALIAIGLGVLYGKQSWKPLVTTVTFLIASAILITMMQPWVLQKHLRNVSNDNVLAYRDLIWERAYTAWKEYPVFGLGMDNFSQVTSARYRQWLDKQGRPYSKERDYGAPHAHNLYLNTLAERGIFGLLFLLSILVAWLATQRPRPARTDGFAWALWGASLSAWFVTISSGLVNTTLHTEHALISVVLLGAWLSYRTQH